MADLTLTRHYAAPPDKVFEVLTRPELILKWWGHEGMSVEPDRLDFTRLGPWGSVLVASDGGRYKMTGQVTHIDPPRSVGFTWAWHDDADRRGVESHVTLSVEPHPEGGTLFRLSHVDLPDDAAVQTQTGGWTSCLRRLDAIFSTNH